MATQSQKLAQAAYQSVIDFRNANTMQDDDNPEGLLVPQENESDEKCQKRGKSNQKKYGTMAHKLPVLVRTAGLVQAVAYVETRGSDPQKLLLAHLGAAVEYSEVSTFTAATRTSNLQDYMLLTRRVLAALLWFKRFAESVLDVQAGDEDDEGATE